LAVGNVALPSKFLLLTISCSFNAASATLRKAALELFSEPEASRNVAMTHLAAQVVVNGMRQ
jgi:hypothetical protein